MVREHGTAKQLDSGRARRFAPAFGEIRCCRSSYGTPGKCLFRLKLVNDKSKSGSGDLLPALVRPPSSSYCTTAKSASFLPPPNGSIVLTIYTVRNFHVGLKLASSSLSVCLLAAQDHLARLPGLRAPPTEAPTGTAAVESTPTATERARRRTSRSSEPPTAPPGEDMTVMSTRGGQKRACKDKKRWVGKSRFIPTVAVRGYHNFIRRSPVLDCGKQRKGALA